MFHFIKEGIICHVSRSIAFYVSDINFSTDIRLFFIGSFCETLVPWIRDIAGTPVMPL